jgi:uncharacterized membrane protein
VEDLIVIAVISVLAGPVLGVAALIAVGRLYRQTDERIASLQAQIDALQRDGAVAPDIALTEQPAEAPTPSRLPAIPEEPLPPPLPEPLPPAIQPAAPAKPRPSLEELIAGRWAIWLGGIALALAGVFLVRYAIDHGLLGPGVRIILGVLSGAGLIAVAERLRGGKPWGRLGAAPANIPPALAGAGVIALFASVYAAYGLYGFIGPLPAFALLTAISGAAMALSLLHGPMIALLGQAGAFVVPALIASDEPSAITLFGYVLAVAAGCLWLARYRGWRWTAWIALAGIAAWFGLWFEAAWRPHDSAAVALFLALATAMFAYAGPQPRPDNRDLLPDAPLAVMAAFGFVLVRMASYDTPALLALAAIAAILIAKAVREQSLDHAPWFGGAAIVAAIGAWHLPQIVEETGRFTGGITPAFTAFVPPPLEHFLFVTTAFGALFGTAGFLMLARATRPVRWAALSAAVPVALFALAYWRIENLDIALPWGMAALLLAALYLALATWTARRREQAGMNETLGIYALATLAGIVLAFTTTLRLGWLTVALALLVPAIAWIEAKLDIAMLRRAALAIATGTTVRLLLNWNVLDYSLGATPLLNGLLWLYGVPAIAMFAGARMMARRTRDATVQMLEVASLAFAVVLGSLEIRHFFGGGKLTAGYTDLPEFSTYSLVWLTIAYALFVRERTAPGWATTWGWRVLALAGAANVLIVQVLLANPLFVSVPVVGAPVLLNALGLAYLAPAVLAGLFARTALQRGRSMVTQVAGIAALALGFIYVTLEAKHLVVGERLDRGLSNDAELYAYSAAWLLYGGALLIAGLRYRAAALRYASLAVLGLTVSKVFLVDMAELTGLLRVASFLGLGVSLIALGWLYQRFVFTRAPSEPAPRGS